MGKKLGTGMLIILATNILNMLFSLITNFVLPKYLSFDSYAVIKTFQLYVAYAGLFHLGYPDGMYLRFGGKELSQIKERQLEKSLSTMRIFQLFMIIGVFIVAIVCKNILLTIFAFDLFSYNMIGFFRSMFQAIGEFKRYARITNIVTILNFVFNMFLIGIVRTDNAYFYVICYTLINWFVWMLMEYRISKLVGIRFLGGGFSWSELVGNIKDGILLLFGNLTSVILTSMDRWFTKFLLTTLDFAQYSFAVSVENFLNIAITPVTITLYNYFCKSVELSRIIKVKNYITIFSTVLIVVFFPIKLILEIYLTRYMDAFVVIALLFASQMFFVIIKSIYVNLYKAWQQQKRYFMEVIIVAIVGFIFNVIIFMLYSKKESFAVGTLCSAIVWFCICQWDFKELRFKIKELIYIIVQLCVFILCALKLSSIIGMLIYCIVTIISTILFMRQYVIELMKYVKSYVSKVVNR